MRPLSPYAVYLGIERVGDAGRLAMPWKEALQGRRDFIHGGVIATFLEIACQDALWAALGEDAASVTVRPANVSTDFLRGMGTVTSHVRADVVRIGKRIANVQAVAWQEDEGVPAATARMHFIIKR